MQEVIRTSGDIRRLIAESMQEVRNGSMDTGKAQAITELAISITREFMKSIPQTSKE